MRIRPLVSVVFVGSVVTACSRADLLGSSGGWAGDAGSVVPFAVGPEASAPEEEDAGLADDGAATIRADATVEAGTMPPQSIDAGTAVTVTCVVIDPSTYDRSCNTDSDCMAITSGVICPVDCVGACPNLAINVNGMTRYAQSVAQLPPRSEPSCECGQLSAPLAFCVQGVCTYL
jgi:hypothetical protein